MLDKKTWKSKKAKHKIGNIINSCASIVDLITNVYGAKFLGIVFFSCWFGTWDLTSTRLWWQLPKRALKNKTCQTFSISQASSNHRWIGIIFLWYHLGIYNEDLTFFNSSRVCKLEDIFVHVPFGSIYHKRRLGHLSRIVLISIRSRMMLTQIITWIYKEPLTHTYPPNINSWLVLQIWYPRISSLIPFIDVDYWEIVTLRIKQLLRVWVFHFVW